jgi:hypothetical protein
MQLDTGAPRTLLYGVPYEQLLQEHHLPAAAEGESSAKYAPTTFSGGIGSLDLDRVPVFLYKNYGSRLQGGQKHPRIGTIGLDVFLERPLILDFPKRRFAVLKEGESIPPELERKAKFFDVTVRDGLLFVPVLHDGQPIGDVFYDTGSSMFSLVVRRSLWQQLTGRTGDEPDNEHRTILSWGNRVVMTGWKTKKSVSVGPVDLGPSVIYFAPADMKHLTFENQPAGVVGLVGNAPFYDDATVILDLPRKRMGIVDAH